MNTNKMNQELGIAEKSIGNHRFEVKLLPCGPAGKVFIELLDILGPSVGVAIDKFRNLDYIAPEEDMSFMEIFSTFSSKLIRGDFDGVIDSVLEGCTIDGKPFDRDSDLRGEFKTYTDLLKFALEENFSDFFIDYLRDMGLEIPSLGSFMEMLKEKQAERERMEDLQEES